MDPDDFDISLLLGLDIDSTAYKNKILFMLPDKPTPFMKEISEIIRMLLCKLTEERLSELLCLPKQLLLLLRPKKSAEGYCPLCDRHYYLIKRHWVKRHDFSTESALSFMKTLILPCEFEMPNEFKMIENNESIDQGSTNLGKLKRIETEKSIGAIRGFYVLRSLKKFSAKNECVICEQCGSVISKTKWNDHIKNHKKLEKIECIGCGLVLGQQDFATHAKVCFENTNPV